MESDAMCLHSKWIYLCEKRVLYLFSGTVFSVLFAMQTPALASTSSMLGEKITQLTIQSDDAEFSEQLHQCSFVSTDLLAPQQVSVSGAAYLERFANQLEENAAYTSYKKRIAERREQLYISGAADILQAFDAKTGAEMFAFTPSAQLAVLDTLAEQNDSHKTYMDSTPVVSEIYDGSQWRTILVGRQSANGKGLFALDITDPDAITVLWELRAAADAFKDLDVIQGHSFPRPAVARLHNGKWAVVIGNGYDPSSAGTGVAALYLLDAMDGSLITSLPVQSDLAQANGLSSPRLADYDGDGIADYAYAGDLHGNLWRFDLLGEGATAPTLSPPNQGSYGAKNGSSRYFKVSYGGKPLFTATASSNDLRQPIIAAPSLVRHPTREGYIVVLGTGQYFASDKREVGAAYANSLYGIWDMQTKAQITYTDTITREQLALQTITGETISIGQAAGEQREARIISNNPVEWHASFDVTQPVKQRGWRLELQVGNQPAGEMLIDSMSTLGSMLLVQTIEPSADPCNAHPSRWLYAINPATGGSLLHHAFINHITDSDVVAAIKLSTPGRASIGQSEQSFFVHTADDQELIAPSPESVGRQSWRIVAEP